MKISALIASAVLGISGVAAAAPVSTVHASPIAVAYRPIQRPQRPQMQRWTLLDTQNGRAGRNVISVSTDQRFTKLAIKATRGSAMIDKVVVTFANGRSQTIDLNERIVAGDYGKQIDLNGNSRQITKIVVVSKGRASSYQVLAA